MFDDKDLVLWKEFQHRNRTRLLYVLDELDKKRNSREEKIENRKEKEDGT